MGLFAAQANALAPDTPTAKHPARPGPAETAIASTSPMVMSASANALETTGTNASAWAREAISGITPP